MGVVKSMYPDAFVPDDTDDSGFWSDDWTPAPQIEDEIADVPDHLDPRSENDWDAFGADSAKDDDPEAFASAVGSRDDASFRDEGSAEGTSMPPVSFGAAGSSSTSGNDAGPDRTRTRGAPDGRAAGSATSYKRHRLSELWGDMQDAERRGLRESMRDEGILNPDIWMLEGAVLDGWHRYLEARELNMLNALNFRRYEGDDPAGFVIRANAHRRHLTATQRTACVVKARDWRNPGGASGIHTEDVIRHDSDQQTPRVHWSESSDPVASATNEQIADEADSSVTTVKRVKRAERFDPNLGDALASGDISLNEAERQIKGDDHETKPPTRTERLQATISDLRIELREKVERIEDLEREIAFVKGESSRVSPTREKQFNDYRAHIRTLRASVAELQSKQAGEHRRAEWWKVQAKELGWEKQS